MIVLWQASKEAGVWARWCWCFAGAGGTSWRISRKRESCRRTRALLQLAANPTNGDEDGMRNEKHQFFFPAPTKNVLVCSECVSGGICVHFCWQKSRVFVQVFVHRVWKTPGGALVMFSGLLDVDAVNRSHWITIVNTAIFCCRGVKSSTIDQDYWAW